MNIEFEKQEDDTWKIKRNNIFLGHVRKTTARENSFERTAQGKEFAAYLNYKLKWIFVDDFKEIEFILNKDFGELKCS